MVRTAFLVFIAVIFVLPQSGHTQALEEIIVTAQKREQNLQDVPISINAVMGETIQNRGFTDLQDLTDIVPNIMIKEGGANDNMFIRGIGSGNNLGFEQSVGTFVDGLYFGRGRHSRAQFMDLDRVEVLRGPQSIFFGNSTIAGAINIHTKKPADQWEGYGKVYYAPGFEEREIELAAGGPLTDSVGIRVAARFAAMDGYLDNIVTGKIEPDEKAKQIRGTISWSPTNRFEATYKFDFAQFDVKGEPTQATDCPPANAPPMGTCALIAGPGAPFTGGFARIDRTKVSAGLPAPFPSATPDFFGEVFQDAKLLSHNLTMNLEWAGHILTSVTGFVGSNDHESIDPDQGPFGILVVQRFESYDQYSQEFRVTSPTGGRFEYLAGVYYQDSKLKLTSSFSNNLFAPPPGPGSLQGTQIRDFIQDEETIAVFGQIRWNLLDNLSASFGFRWSEVDKKATNNLQVRSIAGGPPSPGALGFFGGPGLIVDTRSESDFTPEFTLEWRPVDNALTYFHYTDGFKAGGFNASFDSSLDPGAFQFEPETVDSFEVGAKTTWLDGAMTLNLALFRTEFENLQVSEFDGVSTFVIANAASSTSQGIELEANWQTTDRLRLFLSLAYLDAEFDKFPNASCTVAQELATPMGVVCVQDLSGSTMPYAPEVTGHFGFEYRHPLPYNLELTTNLIVNYTGAFFTAADIDPLLRQSGYAKIDARVGIGPGDGRWEIAFVGRNLTDKLTFGAGDDLPGGALSSLKLIDRPRQLAIQGRYRF